MLETHRSSNIITVASLSTKQCSVSDRPFLGPLAKTAPFWKAVLFNGQILAEAEPGLIWTD